jgi:hypothetical protein
MSKVFRSLALGALLCIAVLGALAYRYHQDVAAWEQVERSLVRLQSGFQFESVIALRSHLADTDAALALYGTGRRMYPPDRKERIRNAEKSLAYISSAIDWQTQSGRNFGGPSLQALEKYPDVTANLYRACEGGQIQAASQSVSSAFEIAGLSLLESSEYPSTSVPHGALPTKYTPLDYQKENTECQRGEAGRRDSEQKKYWAQFRYRVSLRLIPSAPGSCVLYAKMDGTSREMVELAPGSTREVGANHVIEIVDARCYAGAIPGDTIRIAVNGKPYTPEWDGGNVRIAPD